MLAFGEKASVDPMHIAHIRILDAHVTFRMKPFFQRMKIVYSVQNFNFTLVCLSDILRSQISMNLGVFDHVIICQQYSYNKK